jgi:hypothetical protein
MKTLNPFRLQDDETYPTSSSMYTLMKVTGFFLLSWYLELHILKNKINITENTYLVSI